MRTNFDELTIGARFLCSLPLFLRDPVNPDQARKILRARLDRRETDFAALVRNIADSKPRSPYRRLLDLAGCEYGDVETLVYSDGVEGALQTLARNGVYLTVEEFKGRSLVKRGSATFALDPSQLRNTRATAHFLGRSSGSRGTRTNVPLDLAFSRERAVNACLFFEARGGLDWVQAHWEVPGGSAMSRLLWLSGMGCPPVRWFSQVDPSAPGLQARYRWSARLARWGGFLGGVPLASPEYVPLDGALRIAEWMVQVIRTGRTPHLWTYASSAVRLCRAAWEAGVDIRGAQLQVFGEPTTAVRLAAAWQVGARMLSSYGTSECGPIGFGCLNAEAPDEVHLLHDFNAVVQSGSPLEHPSLTSRSLLVTSLRPSAPFVLLNASFGDQAELNGRSCSCALEPR